MNVDMVRSSGGIEVEYQFFPDYMDASLLFAEGMAPRDQFSVAMGHLRH